MPHVTVLDKRNHMQYNGPGDYSKGFKKVLGSEMFKKVFKGETKSEDMLC